MRRIIKEAEPIALAEYKVNNASVPQNLRYNCLTNIEKTAIKAQMLREQRYLCAYLMIRLSSIDECRIEHIEPQSQSQERELDYSNMLVCFPQGRNSQFYPYGECHKAGIFITQENFVSPTDATVENRFEFAYDGSVRGRDMIATSTIEILGLDHDQLKDIRRASIEAAGVSRFSDTPLSAEEAQQLAAAFQVPDGSGRLPEFCVAIAQVARRYAELEGPTIGSP